MKGLIKKFIRYLFIGLWLPREADFNHILNAKINYRDSFIQIGSSDGKSFDPIHDFIIEKDLKGIFVEPVKKQFNELKNTYKNKGGVFFENSAVSDKSGNFEFYHLKEIKDNPPMWYKHISSFDKDLIILYGCKLPEIEKYIVSEEVNCLTFEDLIKKYEIRDLALLHIDAEGHDFKIINSIDLSKIRPKVIFFEHQTIFMNWVSRYFISFWEYLKCLKKLKDSGYSIFKQKGDTLAVLLR